MRAVRRRERAFVYLFLAAQAALPLAYYLGDDRLDERFAWRMFSAERMTRCELGVRVGDRPLALGGRFHEAWLALAERGRAPVVEAMATSLCRSEGGPVRVELRCATMAGPVVLADGRRDVCVVGAL